MFWHEICNKTPFIGLWSYSDQRAGGLLRTLALLAASGAIGGVVAECPATVAAGTKYGRVGRDHPGP